MDETVRIDDPYMTHWTTLSNSVLRFLGANQSLRLGKIQVVGLAKNFNRYLATMR